MGSTFVGAGSQSVTVTDTVTASITGSVGGIAVTAGSAAKLVLSAGDNQSAVVNTGFGSPLVALVTDAFGNPVSGATVTFTASGGTGDRDVPRGLERGRVSLVGWIGGRVVHGDNGRERAGELADSHGGHRRW